MRKSFLSPKNKRIKIHDIAIGGYVLVSFYDVGKISHFSKSTKAKIINIYKDMVEISIDKSGKLFDTSVDGSNIDLMSSFIVDSNFEDNDSISYIIPIEYIWDYEYNDK